MKTRLVIFWLLFALATARVPAFADGEDRDPREVLFELQAGKEISHAGFRALSHGNSRPRAILILCPGQNGDGRELWENGAWREFVRTNGLGLLVPSFRSPDDDLTAGRGYFVAERGSGALLLGALTRMGWDGIPVLLYGFSGGAHFAMSFAAWSPGLVEAFCAYSFAWWAVPPAELACPAIVACGQRDGTRYGASFAYFQSGRRQGKPWVWLSLEGVAHEPSGRLDALVRSFFSSVLCDSPPMRATADNATKRIHPEGALPRVTTSVLPDDGFLDLWLALHHP